MSDPHTRIAELEAELAAVRRELQDFTSAVSHDLRAPLRHIVSFAQLVEEDAGPQLSAEVQGFLATISGSAQHLGAMLDGLRELSRVGSLPLAPGPLALRVLVQEVFAELARSCSTSAGLMGCVMVASRLLHGGITPWAAWRGAASFLW